MSAFLKEYIGGGGGPAYTRRRDASTLKVNCVSRARRRRAARARQHRRWLT